MTLTIACMLHLGDICSSSFCFKGKYIFIKTSKYVLSTFFKIFVKNFYLSKLVIGVEVDISFESAFFSKCECTDNKKMLVQSQKNSPVRKFTSSVYL